MTTRPAVPITKPQREALMYADENGTLECSIVVGRSLIRKGYARDLLFGLKITAAGRQRVATGICEWRDQSCNGPGTLREDPYEMEMYGKRIMTYLCDYHDDLRSDEV